MTQMLQREEYINMYMQYAWLAWTLGANVWLISIFNPHPPCEISNLWLQFAEPITWFYKGSKGSEMEGLLFLQRNFKSAFPSDLITQCNKKKKKLFACLSVYKIFPENLLAALYFNSLFQLTMCCSF